MKVRAMTPSIDSLDHLVLTVRDIDATIAFYSKVLGMQARPFVTATGERRWSLGFGSQKINLHQAGAEFEPKAEQPLPGSADLCFLSATPIRDWVSHLEACEIPVEDGPVQRTGATGPIMSVYLRDPDGNLIEVSNRV